MKTKDYIFLGYPIILIIYIALFTSNVLSCASEGCSISNNLLVSSKEFLNFTGLAFSFSLFLSYLFFKFSLKEIFLNLYKWILFGGLIFETTIFLFQLKNNVFCPYCFGVFSSLWIASLFILKDKIIYLIVLLSSLFIAIFSFNLHSSDKISADVTLITSETCKHCKKVKEELKKQNIKYENIDAEKSSILSSLNINTVPVLIKKENNGFKVIKGEQDILNEFNQNVLQQDITSNDFLDSFNQKNTESCSIKAEKTCN